MVWKNFSHYYCTHSMIHHTGINAPFIKLVYFFLTGANWGTSAALDCAAERPTDSKELAPFASRCVTLCLLGKYELHPSVTCSVCSLPTPRCPFIAIQKSYVLTLRCERIAPHRHRTRPLNQEPARGSPQRPGLHKWLRADSFVATHLSNHRR